MLVSLLYPADTNEPAYQQGKLVFLGYGKRRGVNKSGADWDFTANSAVNTTPDPADSAVG